MNIAAMGDVDYTHSPSPRTAIVIADRAPDGQRANAMLRAQGVEVIRTLGFAEAADADAGLAAALLFVVAGGEPGPDFEDVLDRIEALATRGRAGMVVAIVPELIDRTTARLRSDAVPILCNPTEADAAVTIALALVRANDSVRQDSGGNAERLRGIGSELERIARTLGDLADVADDHRATPAPPPARDGAAEIVAADFRRMLRDRRLREVYLGEGLFADPAWDMLLDLAAARIEGMPVAVSSGGRQVEPTCVLHCETPPKSSGLCGTRSPAATSP
ncbi:MAG TPA: hypothetical protein VF649_12960, partial [Sphingomonas sp.]|uniref:hypothetical protein n=1 Tax=Sphingomonas sp. TaxID=28214 RepID=UPI002EDB9849